MFAINNRLVVLVLFGLLGVDAANAARIVIEAEAADEIIAPAVTAGAARDENPKPPPAREKLGPASGDDYLEIPQGAGSGGDVGGSAAYTLTVPETGVYILWARVWWLDSCGNSFFAKVGDGPKMIVGNDRVYKRWHWVKCRVKLKLDEGDHAFKVTNREDGVKIDQLLFTTDSRQVPVDVEKP